MNDLGLTAAQERAIRQLDGPLFIAAGAGSGKTRVVTSRFIYAVATGHARVDQILTITFTNKAAAEMMERIRKNLRGGVLAGCEADEKQQALMADAYRNIELAQISTIHSFCGSLLRANALVAGLDPEFVTADEARAGIISEESFDIALRKFLERHTRDENGINAVRFISAYDKKLDGSLYKIIKSALEVLRSRGVPARLPVPEPVALAPLAERLVAAAPAVVEAIVREGCEEKITAIKLQDAVTAMYEALSGDDQRLQMQILTEAKPDKTKLKGMEDETEAFISAREDYIAALRDHLAGDTLGMFNELLGLFDAEYAAQKDVHGMLDFSDLELQTLRLLQNEPAVRERVAAQYRLIMVDEYQDINPLQQGIIDLLSADGQNLCYVGDENQSIFGFRDADVDLFRAGKSKAEAGGYLEKMADNFRSHGDILAFVDQIFDHDDMLKPGYLKLKAEAEPDGRDDPRRVEILFIDSSRDSKKEGLEKTGVEITRPAEAQMIAERLRQLYEAKLYSPGETALLVRSRTNVDVYRQALDSVGIANFQAAGVGYFGKLEFGDVLSFLHLLVNPLDDLALVQVLRSPYVDVSDDTLFRLRNLSADGDKRDGPLWPALADGDALDCLAAAEKARVAAFAGALASLREELPQLSLQRLARRAISFNDYDAALAALRGKQTLANLLKLVDLAAAFEVSWGPDLPAFLEFLEHQKDVRAKEADAPVEQEGVEAVRIMTLHKAKGLEFPLVVLPDLSSSGKNNDDIILVDRGQAGNRIGLKYRTADIDAVAAGSAFAFDELRAEEKQREAEELRRLYYVGMTRAMSHLILSGASAADKIYDLDVPFNWLRQKLNLVDDNLIGQEEIQAGEMKAGVTFCADPHAAFQRFTQATWSSGEKDRELFCARELDLPPAARFVPSLVSPTALDTYQACPLRYYYENVLYARDLVSESAGSPPASDGGALQADQRGTLVHAALEELDLAPMPPLDSNYILDLAARLFDAGVVPAEVDIKRAIRLITNLAEADIFGGISAAAAGGSLRRELRFSTMVGPTILRGTIDAMFEADDRVVVVDYKSGRYGVGTADEAWKKYRNQMSSYALAAGLKTGKPVEVVIVFLDDPVKEYRKLFPPDELAVVEADLQAIIDGMASGSFLPLARFDPGQCPHCAAGPNRTRFCIRGARR